MMMNSAYNLLRNHINTSKSIYSPSFVRDFDVFVVLLSFAQGVLRTLGASLRRAKARGKASPCWGLRPIGLRPIDWATPNCGPTATRLRLVDWATPNWLGFAQLGLKASRIGYAYWLGKPS